MGVSPELQSAWTEYWNEGFHESLPGGRVAGSLKELDSAWRTFFLGLPEKASLLDLATGGGDVIRAAIASGGEFNLTGVDLADLGRVKDTFQDAPVALVGNTDLSALPFSDAAFDGVTSQFGIEYADVAAATREAMRVLAPGSRGYFVLHHADSAVTQAASKSLAAYRAVFPDGRAFRAGKAVFELYQRSAPRASIDEAEALFRNAVAWSQSRLRNDQAFTVSRNVVQILAGLASAPFMRNAADSIRQIDKTAEQAQASNLRKRAQVDAALDGKGIARLADCLTGAGAVIDQQHELKYPNGTIMAWGLLFRKESL